jgi:hypothetical protein
VRTRSLVPLSLASLLVLGACAERPTDPAAQNQPTTEAAPPRTVSLRGMEGYATRGEPGGKGFTYGRDGEPIEVSYEVQGGLAIWEGDIVIGRAGEVPRTAQELRARRPAPGGAQRGIAIDGDGFRWPGGVVPYEIAGDLPDQARVTDAISMVEVATAGVNLVPRSGEANFVRFVTSDGCSSAIGMQGGQQNINLGDGCSTGNTAHEILHALAMFHEQSRCDRDDFVEIHLDQVEEGKEGNFDKVCDGASEYGDYAEGSMMHYGPFAFAIGDLPTITSLRGLDGEMGQRSNLGTTDVFTINTLYGANNQAPTALIAALAASYPEGTNVGFNGSGSSDPDDEVLTYAWTFGDGACVSQCTVANPFHAYADNGAYNVNLTVSDGFLTDGDTKVATITNVPPSVNAGAATGSVNEGSLFTRSGSFSDPGTADTHAGTVDYDEGGGVQALALSVSKTFQLSHTYKDNGAYTIAVAVTDDDLGVGNDDVSMTVNNVAPTVSAGADAEVTSGETYNFSGSFSDPGILDAPWDWTIDWGFGTDATGSTNDQAAPIVSSIQVCVAGTYNVVLSVTDKDDDTGTDNLTLTVPFFEVGIDVTPGSTPNPIALSNKGLLPVAILSTATFDATQVDPATVYLGNEVGTDTPVAKRNNGTYYSSNQDVNRDGRLDRVLQFRIPDLVSNGDVVAGTTELVLRGFQVDGCTNFRGEGAVVVVP